MVDWNDLAQDMYKWRAYCESGNKYRYSMKQGEFFDYLKNCQLLTKDSVAWMHGRGREEAEV
jgi:hypothetical protein